MNRMQRFCLCFVFVLSACSAPLVVETPPAPTVAPTPEALTPEAPATPAGAADPLAGTEWTLVSFGAPEAEAPVVAGTEVTLAFVPDGQAGGSSGCNGYSAEYEVQDNTVRFGEVVSTLRACEDEAIMQQEQQFFEALTTASSFELAADQLTIFFGDDQNVLNFVPTDAVAAEGTTPSAATPEPDAMEVLTPTTGLAQKWAWLCYFCTGSRVWIFENGQASQVDLPFEVGVFYDYSPATDRILYATHFPNQGAGPAQISVTDLWMLPLTSQEGTPIFQTDDIVEALWAPDGEQIAYIRATPESYELRWRTPAGEDRLLASDVAFAFSISPDGSRVAFTRESGYQLAVTPGLYVVDVTTGEERHIASVDRAGTGGLEDRPVWSPAGDQVILPVIGHAENLGLWRGAVDASSAGRIEFDPALAAEGWYNVVPSNLLWIDSTHLVGTAYLMGPEAALGGEPHVIRYELDAGLGTVVGGEILAEGLLVGWDQPGASVWVQFEEAMQSVPLAPAQ
jgi:heat shock protein HslJ